MNDVEFMSKLGQINQRPDGVFEIKEHIDFCFTCISKTLPIEQQVSILLKEVYQFKVKEIVYIIGRTESGVKHALENGRKKLSQIFDHKCALINKKGTCHQCSELSGYYNPKSNTQKELVKIKLVRESQDKTKNKLFELRVQLIQSINPLQYTGQRFQDCHMEFTRNVAETLG